MEQVVPAAERYRFEPYLYGPMSREVYRDVRRLRDAGLIAEVPADSDRWRCLVPTPAGVRDALELERPTGTASPDSLSRVRAIRHEVDCMTFDELLRRVYTRYPEYAANSVFRR
jgi:hypothetical protein